MVLTHYSAVAESCPAGESCMSLMMNVMVLADEADAVAHLFHWSWVSLMLLSLKELQLTYTVAEGAAAEVRWCRCGGM
jgi:hypothetical protein